MSGPGPVWFVDVFAERKYAGNQLAVFTDAAHLSTDEMQRVARETNFSETTFIVGNGPAGHKVRIFTPAAEIPFAGHPTLGTAWVLRETVARSAESLTLDLGVGPIRVTFAKDGLVWMRQRAPTFGATIPAGEAARAVKLDASDVDARFPVELVSTGIAFPIVVVKDLATLRKARADVDALNALLGKLDATGILLVALEAYSKDAHVAVRMFAPDMGVPEDPATGSANGCLAAYLSRHRALGSDAVDAVSEQGFEIGRPSRLHLRARPEGSSFAVDVGGRVQLVGRGEFV